MDPGGPLVKRWLPYWRPQPGARLRLLCFPFAGGAALSLQRWARFNPSIEVLAVQYPGRERRLNEPPYRRVPALVDALGPVLRPLLDRPFALFGYSLGTFVCLELARWLERAGAPAPLGLVLAAGLPPHLERTRALHLLPDEELLAELGRDGGTPPEVLAHRELMELLLPMLRADFEMASEYRVAAAAPLSLPLAVWGGAEDPEPSREALERWRDFTTRDFALHIIPGGHFFLHSSTELLREGVERTLLQWLEAAR